MDIDFVRIDRLRNDYWNKLEVEVGMLRLDLIHPEVSGNKWFKLVYNIREAQALRKNSILTFGGAYSNHLHATAFYCRDKGIPSIGIVRGEELNSRSNETLRDCAGAGMRLFFIDRAAYRLKEASERIQDIIHRYNAFVIPEGGDNELGIQGAAEIIKWIPGEWTDIAVSVGSGTTAKGILTAAEKSQTVWGFTSFKNAAGLRADISRYDRFQQLKWVDRFGFGGFGKQQPELIAGINAFYKNYQIPLDRVYTGKMMYGIQQMVAGAVFKPGSRILCIHTGGLQGNGVNSGLEF